MTSRSRAPRAAWILGWLACGLGVASAQGLPGSNLNSINDSLARQGEVRALRQQQTTDFNTLRLQNRRDVLFAPQPDAGPILTRRGAGFATGHRRSPAAGIRRSTGRGVDTGICVGC